MSLTDIGVTLAFLAGIPFIFRYPFAGIVGWYIVSYLNPHRFTYGFAYGMPFGALVGAVTLLAWFLSSEQKRVPLNATTVLLALFTLHFSMTTIFALAPGPAFAEWEQTVKITLMSLVAASLLTSRERMHAMIWVIVLGIGFHGLKGGVFTIITGGGHIAMGPPNSFFGDRNFYAVQLASIIPLMRYLQLHTADRRVRLALTLMMATSAFAVLGTQSRAGFLTLGVLGLYLIFKSRQRLQLIIVVSVLVVAAISFVPQVWIDRMQTLENIEEDRSFQGRVTSWRAAVDIAIERPIRGGGFEAYRSPETATNRAWHSMWFQVLGEQGLLGFALWLGVGATAWWQLFIVRRRARRHPQSAWASDMASMTQVALAAYAVGGSTLDIAYVDLIYNYAVIAIAMRGLSDHWANGRAASTAETPRLTPSATASTSPGTSRGLRRD